jgi:hypothetical protein
MEQLFHFHTGADGVVKLNGNPFDCSILLKNMYTVEAVSLETVEMAHGFYNIRSPFDTFTVDGTSYSIPDGNYTIDTLLTAMSSASGYTFEKVADRINTYWPVTNIAKWDSTILSSMQYLTNTDETLNTIPQFSGQGPTSMITTYPISDNSKVMFSLKINSSFDQSQTNTLGIGNLNFKQYDSKYVNMANLSNCASINQLNGSFYNLNIGGAPLGNYPPWNYGDTVDVCVDTIHYLIWYRRNGGPWTADNSGSTYTDNEGPTWSGPGDPTQGSIGGGGAYFGYLNTAPPYYLAISLEFNFSATLLYTRTYGTPAGYTFVPAQPPGILTVAPNSLLNLLGYTTGNPSGKSTNTYSFPFDKYITIWMENIGTSSNENQKITYKVPISSAKTFWSNNSFNNQIVRNQNSQFPLNRLNIQVLDQFGTKMNNNFVDWSFTLKVRGHRCHPQ